MHWEFPRDGSRCTTSKIIWPWIPEHQKRPTCVGYTHSGRCYIQWPYFIEKKTQVQRVKVVCAKLQCFSLSDIDWEVWRVVSTTCGCFRSSAGLVKAELTWESIPGCSALWLADHVASSETTVFWDIKLLIKKKKRHNFCFTYLIGCFCEDPKNSNMWGYCEMYEFHRHSKLFT